MLGWTLPTYLLRGGAEAGRGKIVCWLRDSPCEQDINEQQAGNRDTFCLVLGHRDQFFVFVFVFSQMLKKQNQKPCACHRTPGTSLFPPVSFHCFISIFSRVPLGPSAKSLEVVQKLLKLRAQRDTEDSPLGSGLWLFGRVQTTTQGCQQLPKPSEVEDPTIYQ